MEGQDVKVKIADWILYLLLAVLSLQIWITFTYPTFARVDLSVNRFEALQYAKDFLVKDRNVDPSQFLSAIAFSSDARSDRYLQRVLGFKTEQDFLARHDFEMFFWRVRFFKEGKKEEYRLAVSPKDGEILSLKYTPEDDAVMPVISQEKAKEIAIRSLSERFGFDADLYTEHSSNSAKLDFRTDHSFAWKKNGVNVLWNSDPKLGGAKLITGASVSGDQISSFYKISLEIPDQFNRHMDSKREAGRNLSMIFRIFYLGLLAGAIMVVVNRRNHLAMNATKLFYFGCVGFLYLLMLLEIGNYFEIYIFDYSTTQPLSAYLAREIISQLINGFFFSIGFLMPCLAGELLHHEVRRPQTHEGFLYYVNSTFLSRHVAHMIGIGYLVAIIMLGLQSFVFEIGYRFFGVWIENTWLNEHTTAYFPFLAAFTIAVKASFTEEITFRLFSISWGLKLFRSLAVAVIASSIIWGFGHAGYEVFPMWFRGLEVSCLGILLSIVYLRFGILATFVAHYLFDAFWGCAAYILGRSDAFNVWTSILVLTLPLMWAALAWVRNRPTDQRPLAWRLNKSQQQNIEILNAYLEKRIKGEGYPAPALKAELVKAGWDVAIIDVAFEPYGIKVD